MSRSRGSFPAPTRADHERFCKREGWMEVRNARGKATGHHVTYELALPDGRILRTRISRPPDRSTYGPGIWRHILAEQLCVSEAEFWACVRKGALPDRGLPPAPGAGLPAAVVFGLLTRVGLSESDIAAMSRDEAVALLAGFDEGTSGHSDAGPTPPR